MFEEPTYLVQVGHNGSRLVREAVSEGHADGGILSPADYKYKKNQNLADDIKSEGGTVLFDPQFYIPRTDRPDFETYPYFEARGGDDFQTGMFASRDERENLCRDIIAVQDKCRVDAYVSPARFLDTFQNVNLDQWLDLTESFIEVAEEEGNDIPIFASLPIDGFELNDNERRNRLLNRVTKIDPDGFYVSVMYDDLDTRLPLNGQENVKAYLTLMSTLRMNRFDVIAAHTHQIAHLLLGLGINAFASGHYQNLRAFDTDRWIPSDGDEIRRQVVRYYSEPLLDSIRVKPQVQDIYTEDDFDTSRIRGDSPYEQDLFDPSTTPENAGWQYSGASWDHYTWSCYQIADRYRGLDVNQRLAEAETKINEAENLYEEVKSTVGEMDEVEDSIYDDWMNAYQEVRSGVNSTRLEMVLQDR